MNDIISTELKRIIYEAVRDALSEQPRPAPNVTPPTQTVTDTDLPPIMSPAQLAKALDVSVRTLERWRDTGSGPAFQHPSGTRLYRYLREDVLAWLRNETTNER